jgi:hypothetical protein
MNLTNIIAGYAALVSTGGVVWEVLRFRQERRLRVEVILDPILLAGEESIGWGARIQVRNRSDHPVRVTMVSLDQDGKKPSIWKPVPATIPGTVEAHDAGSVSLHVDELAAMDLDPSRPIIPWATLSTGEPLEGKAVTVLKPEQEEVLRKLQGSPRWKGWVGESWTAHRAWHAGRSDPSD